MATTTVLAGHVYVTTGTVSGNTITHDTNKAVEIFAPLIEYSYLDNIQSYNFKSSGNTDATKPRKIVNIKDIKKVINLKNAVLTDDTGESATVKRDNLLNMGEFDRELTLLWGLSGNYRTIFNPDHGNNKFGVFILKQTFRETGGGANVKVSSDPQPFRKIFVDIQFIIGQDTSSA